MLILDFNRDCNGKLYEEESKTLYDETFQDLKKFDYYTYFYHKDKKTADSSGRIVYGSH